MFRVRQSQILPQKLDGLLSRFNTEAKVKTVKTKHVPSQMVKASFATTPFKRRRRSRRLAVASGTNIRTTWF